MNDESNVNSLLRKWKQSQKHPVAEGISRAPQNARIPPSRGQQRLWFLQQLYPKSSVYNYSEVYTFKGRLQPEMLKKSLQKIFTDHTIFKNSFVVHDGSLRQKTNSSLEIAVQDFDLSESPPGQKESEKMKILMADAGKPFYLDQPPLIRSTLLKVSSSEWVLLVTLHHIITDKWSMGVFREELARNYKNLCSRTAVEETLPAIQYSDYAYWQQQQQLNTEQLAYWKEKLSGEIPNLELPTKNRPEKRNTFQGETHIQYYSKALSTKIIDLSRQLFTTPYVFLLAVYYLMLYRYSGQNDILIGSPISNRKEKILENLIGFFDETIVLRTAIPEERSFADLVKKVNETTMEAFSNMDITFDQLIKELKPERLPGKNPLFRTMFIYHDVPPSISFGPEVAFSYNFINSGVAKFDLTLYISNNKGLLSSSFEYATDLFDRSTIIQFQEHFKLLLEGIVENPSQALEKIPMQTPWEKQFFSSRGSKPEGPFHDYNSVHELFGQVAAQQPDHPAVVFGNSALTYQELNEQADRIAQGILKYTKGEQKVIGLCADRSLEMISGLLGILKCGCAYLPIDPAYPQKRIDFMLQDSAVPLVLTQKSLGTEFKPDLSTILLIEELIQEVKTTSLPLPEVEKHHWAYVIYTSGSTGNPKGVPITHGNILNSTEGRLVFYPANPKSFLLMSSISFDSSKAGIYWTLCTGGTLVVAENRLEQDMAKMEEVIASSAITHTLMLPSLYKLVLEHTDNARLQSLSAVIVAGEACPVSLPALHFEKLPHVALYNEYGPTEATVWCIAHQIKKEDNYAAIPIGKPVANAEIYLLNKHQERVPYGAKGEIYIGGPGLSFGYLNRGDLTDAAYIPHPFVRGATEKLYKTGDLGRYGKDGIIEFWGRADQQIKIRGFRVEPDEIVKVISEFPGIKEAVVIVETTGSELHTDENAIPETGELMELIEQRNIHREVEGLLDTLQSLSSQEKKYLLQEISK